MIFGGGSTLEQGVGGMPCCLSSTSCCPQPSCNVQTLVLCQPSTGRTAVPSSPSMLESKEERQTPPALALTLLGFIFSRKREIPKKTTTKAKETPKIHFCPRDIRCNPQHHLLWPSQAPRQKGSTAHQQHLLAAPTSTWLRQQQRAFWGHEGYLCTPTPSLGRAGPSPNTVPARDGTVPISAQQRGQSPDFTEVAGAGTGPSRGSGTRSARLCGD